MESNDQKAVGEAIEKDIYIEYELPAFEVIPMPSITNASANNQMIIFDHSYSEICWNDCTKKTAYNYPVIHSGNVQAGDTINIDWSKLKPLPSEIKLIHIKMTRSIV